MLLLDTHQCSGTLLLAYSWLLLPASHVVCLAESPLHYQHVCRKLGGSGSTDALTWSDLSEHLPSSLDALYASISERVAQSVGIDVVSRCIVFDSLFPLCMSYSALELTQFLRKLRVLLGPAGTLVTLMHSDTFPQHLSLLVHDSDKILSVHPVSSSHVSGRLALSFRGQTRPQQCLFTLRETSVEFRPL